jgi:hypothetical protein
MTQPRLELADVIRRHGDGYRQHHSISLQQARVMTHIRQCRTAALGGHVETCPGCDFRRITYNSCRDRHCPKCQFTRQVAWVEARVDRLLPVPYFHVVFTLPHALNPVVLRNPVVMYDLLFQAVSSTLLVLAADRRHLGAQVGITAVLHTWGQNLLLHPHLHCVVTGGGLSPDGQRWVEGRERFLIGVKVLAALFRGKFLAGLKKLLDAGSVILDGAGLPGMESAAVRRWVGGLYAQRWVVYAKPPFGGPEQVFRYLGRYTHRVAITNNRLVSMADGQVSFTWKDYADEHKRKVMRLDAEEFLRRFLLHVLPRGFVRIRHYGLMASGNVSGKLAQCRQLLQARGATATPSPPQRPSWVVQILADLAGSPRCPRCRAKLIRTPFDGAGPPVWVLPGPRLEEHSGRVPSVIDDTS